jgi:hypothetical protein
MLDTRRHIPSHVPSLACTLFLVLFGACSPAAIDIVLSIDGDTSDPEYVFANLSALQLTLDSNDGLYPAGSQRELGDLTIGNYDGDPASELRYLIGMESSSSLPIIRVEQGGLPSASDVEIFIDGLYGTTEKTFASTKDSIGDLSLAGGYTLTSAELKLALAHQAPRVMQTGVFKTTVAGPDEGTSSHMLRVNFSYLMDSAPFYSGEAISFSRREGGTESVVQPTKIVVTDIKPYSTYVDLEFVPALKDGTYVLRVLPVVYSNPIDSGIAKRLFDQYPSKVGSQGFEALMELDSGGTNANTPTIVTPDVPCGDHGGVCPDGMRCVDEVCRQDACEECGAGSVCHPDHKLCVVDCREYRDAEGCLDQSATCGDDGICSN